MVFKTLFKVCRGSDVSLFWVGDTLEDVGVNMGIMDLSLSPCLRVGQASPPSLKLRRTPSITPAPPHAGLRAKDGGGGGS